MVRKRLRDINIGTLFIRLGRPWENGYIKRFNGKLRDEMLNGEIFYSLKEAQVLLKEGRLNIILSGLIAH